MSYSERHTGTVSYSGSKTVHYPASEHGGSITVHYSGTVPVGITINVQTGPFDRSVSETNTSLGLVAGAVAATEAAQVAEITRAGNQIAQTAINGFFRVLSSEMSAQMSEFSSSMKSCVGLLAEEGRQVEHIHAQMDADYHRIMARYVRLFDELDRELDRRVHELNRPAFQICQHAMRETVAQPYAAFAARAATHEGDIAQTTLKLTCAQSKQRVSSSLGSLGDMCDYLCDYQDKVSDAMCDETGEGDVLMPVVYTLQKDLDAPSERVVVHGGDSGLEQCAARGVIAHVASTSDGDWQALTPADQQAIDASFMRLVEDSDASLGNDVASERQERVRRMMVELYRRNRPVCNYATKNEHATSVAEGV